MTGLINHNMENIKLLLLFFFQERNLGLNQFVSGHPPLPSHTSERMDSCERTSHGCGKQEQRCEVKDTVPVWFP